MSYVVDITKVLSAHSTGETCLASIKESKERIQGAIVSLSCSFNILIELMESWM